MAAACRWPSPSKAPMCLTRNWLPPHSTPSRSSAPIPLPKSRSIFASIKAMPANRLTAKPANAATHHGLCRVLGLSAIQSPAVVDDVQLARPAQIRAEVCGAGGQEPTPPGPRQLLVDGNETPQVFRSDERQPQCLVGKAGREAVATARTLLKCGVRHRSSPRIQMRWI